MLSSFRQIPTRGRLLTLSQSCFTRRTYASTPESIPYAVLPDHDDWRTVLPCHNPFVRDRVSVANPATASRLAKAFMTGKSPAAGKNKIVIEAFPGAWFAMPLITLPDLLSRAGMSISCSIEAKIGPAQEAHYSRGLRTVSRVSTGACTPPRTRQAY